MQWWLRRVRRLAYRLPVKLDRGRAYTGSHSRGGPWNGPVGWRVWWHPYCPSCRCRHPMGYLTTDRAHAWYCAHDGARRHTLRY